jgi:hypothetical protein
MPVVGVDSPVGQYLARRKGGPIWQLGRSAFRQAGLSGGFVGLARTEKLHYACSVASGVFPPTRYRFFQLRIKFL